jgi:hypothetical protein
MMTPKERAEELVRRMGLYTSNEIAKKCALIALDEMLDIRNGLYINEGSIIYQYLLGVKKEIEML